MSPDLARKILRVIAPPAVVLALLLVGWQLGKSLSGIESFVLPGPLEVAEAAWEKRVELMSATMWTALAAATGFAASVTVGVAVAVAFSTSRWMRAGCYPYAVFLQTVPIVAIAPLIVIWFGHGLPSVVLVSFIVSLFPIITNATTGLMSADQDLLDLFELHNASRLQTLLKLRLPTAVPFIVAGARVSAGMAVIGAIVGEFFLGFGAQRFGLGYLIIQTTERMRTAELFGAVLASTALGMTVFAIVQFASRTILRRWRGA